MGWSVGWSRAGSFSPLISDACCVSNEEEEERKRGRKKASVGDKLIMEGARFKPMLREHPWVRGRILVQKILCFIISSISRCHLIQIKNAIASGIL